MWHHTLVTKPKHPLVVFKHVADFYSRYLKGLTLKKFLNLSIIPHIRVKWGQNLLKLFVSLVVLRLNVPVNIFSVMSGWSQCFLGLTSTAGSKCALLKDTTRCRIWGSNPGPLDSEFDALPICHHAPWEVRTYSNDANMNSASAPTLN